jgi:AcrR family transcriptional regulator
MTADAALVVPSVAAPVRRTRPRGRSVLHREQVEDSRNRILAAARAVFTANSYGATSVDMILAAAGVGRSTFYKHFASKYDLARGLLHGYLPEVFAVFDRLPDRPGPAEAQAWLHQLLALYRENKAFTALLKEISGSEPAYFPEMTAIHEELLRRLGARIPAFARAASGRPEESGVHVLAHLQIHHIFGFCHSVVSDGWDVDVEAGLAYLAQNLAAFIREHG